MIDHWWQTETGWSICANPSGLGLLPVKYGSPGVPMPGYDIRILDEGGTEDLPVEVDDALFSKAWEHGHSSGYHEVEYYYCDLADLVLAAYRAGKQGS